MGQYEKENIKFRGVVLDDWQRRAIIYGIRKKKKIRLQQYQQVDLCIHKSEYSTTTNNNSNFFIAKIKSLDITFINTAIMFKEAMESKFKKIRELKKL